MGNSLCGESNKETQIDKKHEQINNIPEKKSNITKFPKCEKCNQEYNNTNKYPISYSCGESICLECHYINGGVNVCPFCGQTGRDDPNINFTLLELINDNIQFSSETKRALSMPENNQMQSQAFLSTQLTLSNSQTISNNIEQVKSQLVHRTSNQLQSNYYDSTGFSEQPQSSNNFEKYKSRNDENVNYLQGTNEESKITPEPLINPNYNQNDDSIELKNQQIEENEKYEEDVNEYIINKCSNGPIEDNMNMSSEILSKKNSI